MTVGVATCTVSILENRAVEALKRIRSLAKRAGKTGSDVGVLVGDPVASSRTVTGPSGVEREVETTVVPVSLTGGTPRCGEWRIAARVDRGAEGNTLTYLDGEVMSHSLNASSGFCDHCEKKRERKVLFLARHDDGREIVVGKSCLREFMEVDDPASVSSTFTIVREMREMETWDFSDGSGWDHLEELVARCVAAVAEHGWTSVAASGPDKTSTRDLVEGSYSDSPMFHESAVARGAKVAEVLEVARAVIENVRDFPPENEFGVSASEVFSRDQVIGLSRWTGTVAAATARSLSRLNLLEEATRDGAEPSRHVGRPGERLRSVSVEVTEKRTIPGHHGDTVLYTMIADGRDVVKWFCTMDANHEVGSRFEADATVKRHGEFCGTRETVVTRVRVVSPTE